jgi:hypothetical protein
VLVRYKHEEHGNLDFKDSGLNPADCRNAERDDNRDHISKTN